MRKRGLSAVDAICYNVHELLLQAPKKPRQRYGPRQRKKQKNWNVHEDCFETGSTMTNVASDGFEVVARRFKHPDAHCLRENEPSDDDGNDDESCEAPCVRDDTTRARNREHARATRRRRRIFKEIDCVLHQLRANTKKPNHATATSANTVDPLFPAFHYSS